MDNKELEIFIPIVFKLARKYTVNSIEDDRLTLEKILECEREITSRFLKVTTTSKEKNT